MVIREAPVTWVKLFGNDYARGAETLDKLAILLSNQGKRAEAEIVLHQELALQRKLHGDEDLAVATCLRSVVEVLLAQHKYAEAEELFANILKPALQNQPSGARLLHVRAEFRARRRQWKEAATDFASL